MTLRRPLSEGEWARLSPGLGAALRSAGAVPHIVASAHPAARLTALWRDSVPILTRGDDIWWPRAPADLSLPGGERGMAVLQHELQHVLDYRTGWLTAGRYLASPRHWLYACALRPGLAWEALGAEQRASLAERLWLAQRRLSREDAAALAALIPWARPRAPEPKLRRKRSG